MLWLSEHHFLLLLFSLGLVELVGPAGSPVESSIQWLPTRLFLIAFKLDVQMDEHQKTIVMLFFFIIIFPDRYNTEE